MRRLLKLLLMTGGLVLLGFQTAFPASADDVTNLLCQLPPISCPASPAPSPTASPVPTPSNVPKPTPQVFVPQAPPPAPLPSPSPSRKPAKTSATNRAPASTQPAASVIDAISPDAIQTAAPSQPELSAPELPELRTNAKSSVLGPFLFGGIGLGLVIVAAIALGVARHGRRVTRKLTSQNRIFGAVEELKRNLDSGQGRVGSW